MALAPRPRWNCIGAITLTTVFAGQGLAQLLQGGPLALVGKGKEHDARLGGSVSVGGALDVPPRGELQQVPAVAAAREASRDPMITPSPGGPASGQGLCPSGPGASRNACKLLLTHCRDQGPAILYRLR